MKPAARLQYTANFAQTRHGIVDMFKNVVGDNRIEMAVSKWKAMDVADDSLFTFSRDQPAQHLRLKLETDVPVRAA